jgi:hypothetical protein
MFIVAMAAISMVIADVLSVLLVQAEARNRAFLAGVLDTLGWGAAIVVTFLTVNSLQGHDLGLKVGVVIAVSLANFVGSYVGVKIGRRFVKEDPTTTLAERVQRLEAVVITPFDNEGNAKP